MTQNGGPNPNLCAREQCDDPPVWLVQAWHLGEHGFHQIYAYSCSEDLAVNCRNFQAQCAVMPIGNLVPMIPHRLLVALEDGHATMDGPVIDIEMKGWQT